jgi:hypothetical protein
MFQPTEVHRTVTPQLCYQVRDGCSVSGTPSDLSRKLSTGTIWLQRFKDCKVECNQRSKIFLFGVANTIRILRWLFERCQIGVYVGNPTRHLPSHLAIFFSDGDERVFIAFLFHLSLLDFAPGTTFRHTGVPRQLGNNNKRHW